MSSSVISTRRVDERHSRLCENEFGWSSSVFKHVTFTVMSQKITVVDASAMRCVANAMIEIAIERGIHDPSTLNQ